MGMYDMTHYGHDVCPICGSVGWCGYRETQYVGKKDTYTTVTMYCHRYTKPLLKGGAYFSGDDVTLANGERYHFVGETPDGFGKFRDYDSWERQQKWEAFKNEHPEKAASLADKRAAGSVSVLSKPKQDNTIPPREPEYLDRVYRSLLSSLVLVDDDRQELKDHDKWSDEFFTEVTDKYPLVTLPPADWDRFSKEHPRSEEFARMRGLISNKKLIEKLTSEFGTDGLKGVPGFYKRKNGAWAIAGMDGYLIPQYNMEGLIYRLRVRTHAGARRDAAHRKFEKLSANEIAAYAAEAGVKDSDREAVVEKIAKSYGKYVAFSSPYGDCGCASGSNLSFYGLDLLDKYGDYPIKRVIVCEGEKKGIVASQKLGYLVITLPGVGTYKLLNEPLIVSEKCKGGPFSCIEWLKILGIERISVANDMDMFENANVKKATKGLIDLIQSEGLTAEIVMWSQLLGKGIDDCLMAGGIPKFQKIKK